MKQPYNTTIYNTALYMRLSRDDELQGESGSIQTQRMMLRQYAAEHGLNQLRCYEGFIPLRQKLHSDRPVHGNLLSQQRRPLYRCQ